MKSIKKIIHNRLPHQEKKNNQLIEILLRRGEKTLINPQFANEMICQDCGGNKGKTWLEDGKWLWFCKTPECLSADSRITKKRARNEWWLRFQKNANDAEQKKANKEWDGL